MFVKGDAWGLVFEYAMGRKDSGDGEGRVRRFVRSKVWQNVAGGNVDALVGAMVGGVEPARGARLGVGGGRAVTISHLFKPSNQTSHPSGLPKKKIG
jgi:hypothetical protein